MHRPLQAAPKERGLVLLEVLVAAGVLAVLAALAVPSFAALAERMKLRNGVQALTSSLYAARAEALKRGGHVTLARSGGPECGTGGQWSCGWIVFADEDESGTRDTGEELLHAGQAPPGIDVTQTSQRAALKISAWGQFSAVGLSFELRSRAERGLRSRICISSGGRLQSWAGVDECPGS